MPRPETLFSVGLDFFEEASVYMQKEANSSVCQDENCSIQVSNLQIEEDASESDSEAFRLKTWTCLSCGMKFLSGEDQRAHFKSDFHRLNVKRKLAGKPCFNEEEFENHVNADRDFDVSSVSGSDSEIEEQEKNPREAGVSNHVLVQLKSGSIVQIWRCIIQKSKETGANTEEEIISRIKALVSLPKVIWIVLLAVGGHFAGVVVDMKSGSVQAHQTYHRYVVRAKAGGKQANRDATGRAAKSAGASLRRYNELALQKEIKKLLESWSKYLLEANCVFIFAPSRNSQSVFGENPLLDRHDARIRHIPFPTRRPTYKEARRVYEVLSSLHHKETSVVEEATVSPSANTEMPSSNVDKVSGRYERSKEVPPNVDVEKEDIEEILTPLHEAAIAGNATLVAELLEQGADPCVKRRGKTAYSSATDKDTRNIFRKFMASHSDMWDWHAAGVPSALTDEMEAAQAAKQAEKNAKRRAKEKERKKERKAQQKAAEALKESTKAPPQEAAEIAKAKERELRAAAAEKRMLIPVNSTSSEVCSCCSSSLANKVPFYKYEFKYCSVACVNSHIRD